MKVWWCQLSGNHATMHWQGTAREVSYEQGEALAQQHNSKFVELLLTHRGSVEYAFMTVAQGCDCRDCMHVCCASEYSRQKSFGKSGTCSILPDAEGGVMQRYTLGHCASSW